MAHHPESNPVDDDRRQKFLESFSSIHQPTLRCINPVCQSHEGFTSAYLGSPLSIRLVAVFQCHNCGVHHFTCKPCFFQKKLISPYNRATLWRHIRDNHSFRSKPLFDNALDIFLDHAGSHHTRTLSSLITSSPPPSPVDSSPSTPSLLQLLVKYNDQMFQRANMNYDITTSFVHSHSDKLSDIVLHSLSQHISNPEFFEYFHNGQSLKYLTARGMHQCVGLVNHISQDDAAYHVLMAKSFYDMTSEQRKEHFQGKQMEAKKVTASVNNSIVSLPVPAVHSRVLYSLSEVDRHYLKNQKSIIMSLPIPAAEMVDGHAYVSPVCAIQHILAFAPPLDFVTSDTLPVTPPTSVHSMWDSARGRQIAQLAFGIPGGKNAAVFYLYLWSDDYDSASVKRGRGSTWALTMTLSPPVGSNSNDHSVPLAFGHKSWSHMAVYNRLWSDLHLLKSQCTYLYHGGLKAMIPIIVPHAVTLRDTPERRSGNCVISSAGSFGLVIDMVVDIGRCACVLPSCKECFRHRLRLLGRSRSCSVCADWDLASDKCTVNTKLTSKKDDEIKREMDRFVEHKDEVDLYKVTSDGGIVVPPRKRTFSLLEKCSQQAYKRVCVNHWSSSSAKQYMATAGIPDEFQKSVLKAANEMKKDIRQLRLPMTMDNVDMDRIPKCPVWENIVSPLSTNIPVPMHLFFHGITNTTFELIGNWLTKYKLRSSLSDIVSKKLSAVESLSLESFKALETGVKEKAFSTGGYQAENFRCMALLFRWLFPDVQRKLKMDPSENDYKDKSQQYKLFENLVELLLCITARAMTVPIVLATSPADMERHCKLFLSTFTDFQGSFQDSGTKPSFVTAPNFGALIQSVSDTMKEYPPYRTLWEGGPRGEGLLRSIKKHTFKHSSKSHSWTMRLMERVYRFDVLRRLGVVNEEENSNVNNQNNGEPKDDVSHKPEQQGGNTEDSKQKASSLLLRCILGRHKKFCSYESGKWLNLFDKHVPISAIMLSSGDIVVIRRLGRELLTSVIGATITFKDSKGKLIMGGWYAPIRVNIHEENDLVTLDNNKLTGYVPLLILPLAALDQEPRNVDTLYYCITNEWTERSRNNTFILPRFSKARYP